MNEFTNTIDRVEELTKLLKHTFVAPEEKDSRFCRLCHLYLTDDVHCRVDEKESVIWQNYVTLRNIV